MPQLIRGLPLMLCPLANILLCRVRHYYHWPSSLLCEYPVRRLSRHVAFIATKMAAYSSQSFKPGSLAIPISQRIDLSHVTRQ